MKYSTLSAVLGSLILIASMIFIISIPADAETGSVTISSGYEDGYEEYLGAPSDPMNYWRVHYDWTITSGDASSVRFSITDLYDDTYGGSNGESTGDGYIQVTEGAFYFSWTNNGDYDITVDYDIWYEEVSPFDDGPVSSGEESVSSEAACCGSFMALGIFAVIGSFTIIVIKKR